MYSKVKTPIVSYVPFMKYSGVFFFSSVLLICVCFRSSEKSIIYT